MDASFGYFQNQRMSSKENEPPNVAFMRSNSLAEHYRPQLFQQTPLVPPNQNHMYPNLTTAYALKQSHDHIPMMQPHGMYGMPPNYELNQMVPLVTEIQTIRSPIVEIPQHPVSLEQSAETIVKETQNLVLNPPKRNLKRASTDTVASLDETRSKMRMTRQTRLFTGTIAKVIAWFNFIPVNVFAMFEVIAPCLTIRNGTIPGQKNLLLRDERGPVLQVTYYETELELSHNVKPGVLLRCVGRMVLKNRMIAVKIVEASSEMQAHLYRLTYKSEHAINRLNA